MALSLAGEASFLASAQGIVGNEAADASRLAWATTSPGVDSAPIQSVLLRYLRRPGPMSGTAAARPMATILPPRTLWPAWRAPSGPRRAARPSAPPRAPNCCLPLDAPPSPTTAAPAWPPPPISYPQPVVIVLALTGLALLLNTIVLTLRSGLRPALLASGLAS